MVLKLDTSKKIELKSRKCSDKKESTLICSFELEDATWCTVFLVRNTQSASVESNVVYDFSEPNPPTDDESILN
jgi:hypothetical protein